MYYTKHPREEHAEFIECVNEIYAILIELRFLRPEEVVYPPYNVPGKPSLATRELKALGFTDEVVALLEELPYPSNDLTTKFSHLDEGVPLAPDSFAVSYLAGARIEIIKAARQPFYDGEVGIPAWAFKLTASGVDFGTTYIYDTRMKNMVRWDSQNCFEYVDQPVRSMPESRTILINELRSLDWLPWRVEYSGTSSLNVYTRPSYKQHMSSMGSTNRYSQLEGNGDCEDCDDGARSVPESPMEYGADWIVDEVHRIAKLLPALKRSIDEASTHGPLDVCTLRALAIAQGIPVPEIPPPNEAQHYFSPKYQRVNRRLEIARAVQNRYHYKRNIYEECGWPHNFRGDEFEKRRAVIEKEHYDLAGLLGPQAMRIQDAEKGRYLREWYRQKAGAAAE